MKLEDQVCNLELSKRLHELGVRSESFFHWYVSERSGYSFILESKEVNYSIDSQDKYEVYSAHTASELFELFHQDGTIHKSHNLYRCSVHIDTKVHYDEYLPNSLAKNIVHLIENNLLEIK